MDANNYQQDINELLVKGERLSQLARTGSHPFMSDYQQWYIEAQELVRQILPSKLGDFDSYYEKPSQRGDCLKNLFTLYSDNQGVFTTNAPHLFQQQLGILKGVSNKFRSSLFNIKDLLHADLLDDELEMAQELLENGYTRAAGVLAGVALESYLKSLVKKHNIALDKERPAISNYNELLRKNDIFETHQWRKIQHLADLRNKCAHLDQAEPTKAEVQKLIDEVRGVIRNCL